MAWRLTGQDRFLDATAKYLDAWAATYVVSHNPIDEECFERIMLAADLVRERLSPTNQANLDRFIARFAAGYLDFIEASRQRASLRGTDRNNWNSHRVKIAVLAAYAGGDAATVARARAAFDLQLARNIKPSGEVIDFTERDALHYVVYSLLPLSTACAAAAAHGESWLDRAPAGAGTVRAGLEWLLPYIRGEKTHQEFVRSTVRLDAERAAAGIEGFAGPWKRERALDLAAFAAHLDPGAYRPAYERLARETRRQASDWMRILFT